MEYRSFGKTGWRVSVLGFGASSLGSVFREVDEQTGICAVRTALDLGINLIDVSPYYGLTRAETVLGRALAGVPRDQYYLATKCGRYGTAVADCDYSAGRVRQSVEQSLNRLGVEHLDLIQIHDIEFGDLRQIVEETVPALVKIKQSGKARMVGLTGLPLAMFGRVIEQLPPGAVDSILSYCHYELNDTALLEILPAMERSGIGVMNASPLGMGLLSLRGTPAWHPAPEMVKQRCRQAAEHCRAKGGDIATLALQFAVAQPRIATTLFGSANPENIVRNVACLEQPIDEPLLREVLEILQPIHNVTWPQGRSENNGNAG